MRSRFHAAMCAALLLATAACTPALPDGASMRTLRVGDATRSYVLFEPKTRSAQPALVLVLHGRGRDGASIERYTRGRFDQLAERDGFIVAYPNALGRMWNAGHWYETSEGDDVAFLSALADLLIKEFHADPDRVFVTGFSNGAAMTYRFACERPDTVAAIAPVAGGLAERLMRPCAAASTRPIPLLLMHGTADSINPFDDGERAGNIQYWIRRNGCSTSPVVSRLPDTEPDGTQTRVERYGNCRNGADVAMYVIEEGGHRWPGADEPFRPGNGKSIRDFDAGIVIWDFFRAHPRPATQQ